MNSNTEQEEMSNPDRIDPVEEMQKMDLLEIIVPILSRLSGIQPIGESDQYKSIVSKELYEGESCRILALLTNSCYKRPSLCRKLLER